MDLHLDGELHQDLLRDALLDRIKFSETYEPPEGDDERDEVIASHREDAGELRVLLMRLELLGE